MRLTKQQFINRFTPAEMMAILAAAKTSIDVEAWLFRFDNLTPGGDGTAVDTTDPLTVKALHDFETAELLAVGRANEILSVLPGDNGVQPTVSLDAGQLCLREPEWSVVTGGTYLVSELVEVMAADGRSCAFQANYIATGEFL
jgi:hypothetical protein